MMMMIQVVSFCVASFLQLVHLNLTLGISVEHKYHHHTLLHKCEWWVYRLVAVQFIFHMMFIHICTITVL